MLAHVKAAALDSSYVSLGSRRTSSVHEFYRYPARFSPAFARAVILAFSEPGQMVCDPFVGGGTTVVESRLTGRLSVGADLNALATFVTRAKGAVQAEWALQAVRHWGITLPRELNIRRDIVMPEFWKTQGYFRNFDGPDTWRIRKVIALALRSLGQLSVGAPRDLGRLAILRTAQWALDMRSELPTVEAFRVQLVRNVFAMADTAEVFAEEVADADLLVASPHQRMVVLNQGLPGLADHRLFSRHPKPNLILTSPPYPKVYVLYHRWKLRGRLETPAPFWVADCLDGNGQGFYTLGARSQKQTIDGYFARLRAAYEDVARLAGPDTWVVQMVGFSDVRTQLPRYLHVMESVGLQELRFDELATAEDGRLWRRVPSRRWWVTSASRTETALHTASEVVLVHRLRRRELSPRATPILRWSRPWEAEPTPGQT